MSAVGGVGVGEWGVSIRAPVGRPCYQGERAISSSCTFSLLESRLIVFEMLKIFKQTSAEILGEVVVLQVCLEEQEEAIFVYVLRERSSGRSQDTRVDL